ncbi:MAG: toll/interleukin-1 receptor domain-containing protein [Desulfobacterales bacterium]|nr:toll/interleukin-1 receptor domain-containing protein [Desulfobacterales bacterium]
MGESSFIPEGMEERIDVKKLLHGIESQKTKLFISYVPEDTQDAEKMYEALNQYGAEPFFAKESLVPGQRREVAIRQAIKDSRFFIALLSSNSVKKGIVNREVASALEQLDDFPESDIFIIPVRLDECTPSHEKLEELHFVDMFPNWEQGFEKIIQAIEKC